MEMSKEDMNELLQDLTQESMEKVAGGYQRIGYGRNPGGNGGLREQAEAMARLKEEIVRESIRAAKESDMTLEQYIETFPIGDDGFLYNMKIILVRRLWDEV